MEELIYTTPLWGWVLIAAVLGAATLWVYWRCQVEEDRRLALLALDARDRELTEARAALTDSERRQLDTADAPPEEVPSLRRRVWELESRLRQALDAARSGASGEMIAAFGAGIGAADEDPDAQARRRYNAWLAEIGARDADAPPPPSDEDLALEARAARLEDRLQRLLSAAKLGRLDELAEIEREIEAEGDGSRLADLAAASQGFDLLGDGQPSSLRYRNWALSTRLRKVLNALRAGETVDPERIEAELRGALRAPRDAAADPTMAADETPDVAAPPFAVPADQRLQEENSGLRYRNWMLSGGLETVADALRRGETPDLSRLEQALALVNEPALDRPAEARSWAAVSTSAAPMALAAPIESDDAEPSLALRAAAETLRRRVATLEAALSKTRSRQPVAETVEGAAAPNYAAAEEAASLRYQLWLSQSELRRLRDAGAAEPVALPDETEMTARIHAALDEAASLRGRLALAESALRDTRREVSTAALVAAQTVAAPAEAPTEALEIELARARAEITALRGRVWTTEWRLAQTQAAFERAGTEQTDSDWPERLEAAMADAESSRALLTQAETALRQMREDAAREAGAIAASGQEAERQRAEAAAALVASREVAAKLRARLWSAEWRLGEIGEADKAAAEELERLRGELSALEADRREKAQAEETLDEDEADAASLAEELLQATTELEGLRSRLAAAEAERERLVAEAGQVRSPAASAAVEKVSAAHILARGGAQALSARARRAQPADAGAESARAALKDVFDTPYSEVEAKAADLIERGSVIAISSNRPSSLVNRLTEGPPDDLKLIANVSPKIEALMNNFGLYYFRQIAEFGPSELAWIDDRLAMRGGVVRERWSPQAQRLSELKNANRLVLGPEGAWTAPPDGLRAAGAAPQQAAAPAQPGVASGPLPPLVEVDGPLSREARRAAEEETIETVPPHPNAVSVSSPMSGAEAAALELIQSSRFFATPTGKPQSFGAPVPADEGDDFRMIRGVGPKLDAMLKTQGVSRFEQLASLNPDEIAWLDRALGLGGRIVKDRWLPQARKLAARRDGDEDELPPTPPLIGDGGAHAAGRGGASISMAESVGMPRDLVLGQELPHEPADETGSNGDHGPVEAAALRLIESGDRVRLPGGRPSGALDDPSDGAPDDLKLIRAIGPKFEAQLNDLGFHYFHQIARLTAQELAWLDQTMRLKGRTVREHWPSQAAELAERKAKGGLHIGGEGSWTAEPARADAERAAEEAKETPLSEAEREAMRLLNAGFDAYDDHRPSSLLAGPSGASPDDLKQIQGVNQRLETALNGLGVYYFDQIAGFAAPDIAWVDAKLRLGGRILRERWVAQAAAFVDRRRNGGEG